MSNIMKGITENSVIKGIVDEDDSSPYQEGYEAWKDYLAGKTKQRPVNPYPAGKGMGEWENGAGDAAEHIDWGNGPLEETESKKGPGEVVKKVFKHKGKPVGEIGVDLASSPGGGMYYMKYYGSGRAVSGYDSMEEAFAVLKHYLNQMKEGAIGETEAKKGADGKRCWKGKRYAGTENGKDKCVPVKNESKQSDEYNKARRQSQKDTTKALGYQSKASIEYHKRQDAAERNTKALNKTTEAANPAQQAAIAISKKKKHKKPANEGVIVGHDANDPEVAVLGGAGTMSLSRLKKKAHQEALQLADDIANGKYSVSSYNMKQLHNTLNTIVAAEKEMEKLYFGEDLNEDWVQGAGAGFLMGLGTGHPTLGTVLGAALGAFITAVSKAKGLNAAKENPKYYIFVNGKQHDNEERSAWDAAAIIADLAAKEHDIKTQFTIADAKTGKVVFRKYWEPEKEEGFMSSYKPAGWTDRWHDDDIKEDYTGEFAAEKTPAINPYGGLKDRKFRGAIGEALLSEMPDTSGPVGVQPGGWRRTDIDEYREMSPALKAAQQNLIALRNKEKSVNVPGKRERAPRDKVELDKPKPASVLTKGAQEVDPDTMDAIAAFLAKGGEIKKGRPGKAPPTGRQQASKHIGGGGKYRRKSDTPGQGANYRGAAIVAVEEDTAYASGMGQGGNAGQSYRKFKPKSAGTYKESSIMKGLKR